MNKSHITSDQVKSVLQMYWHADDPSKIFSQVDLQDMHRALEAAFPEPSIQELLRDEERSARHDDPQPPAAFSKLVVTEDDAEEINYAKDIREALQSFVYRHSIKPIAFADRMPKEGQECYAYYQPHQRWCYYYDDVGSENYTHWLPASALPIPEPAVDAKEEAWNRYCDDCGDPYAHQTDECAFKAGYEAAWANNIKSPKN